jgi:hypothetical protein
VRSLTHSQRTIGWTLALLVLTTMGVALSCSSQQTCMPRGAICVMSRSVTSPCEIVSFTTTCRTPVGCKHGECVIGIAEVFTENCTITAQYDDNTTAVSYVTSSADICGCTSSLKATNFIPVKGSTCSPPKSNVDASTDAPVDDGSARDAANDGMMTE